MGGFDFAAAFRAAKANDNRVDVSEASKIVAEAQKNGESPETIEDNFERLKDTGDKDVNGKKLLRDATVMLTPPVNKESLLARGAASAKFQGASPRAPEQSVRILYEIVDVNGIKMLEVRVKGSEDRQLRADTFDSLIAKIYRMSSDLPQLSRQLQAFRSIPGMEAFRDAIISGKYPPPPASGSDARGPFVRIAVPDVVMAPKLG